MGKARSTRSDTYANLAILVLKRYGKPMHYKHITEQVMKLRKYGGKTPAQTLRVVLSKDNRFRLIRKGTGMYGLTSWE